MAGAGAECDPSHWPVCLAGALASPTWGRGHLKLLWSLSLWSEATALSTPSHAKAQTPQAQWKTVLEGVS